MPVLPVRNTTSSPLLQVGRHRARSGLGSFSRGGCFTCRLTKSCRASPLSTPRLGRDQSATMPSSSFQGQPSAVRSRSAPRHRARPPPSRRWCRHHDVRHDALGLQRLDHADVGEAPRRAAAQRQRDSERRLRRHDRGRDRRHRCRGRGRTGGKQGGEQEQGQAAHEKNRSLLDTGLSAGDRTDRFTLSCRKQKNQQCAPITMLKSNEVFSPISHGRTRNRLPGKC